MLVVIESRGAKAYDRGPSDHTGYSDNSNSFWHHSDITNGRNIDLWEGILTMKANNMVAILTDKSFLCQNYQRQPGWGAHRIHINGLIVSAHCYRMSRTFGQVEVVR